MLLAATRPTFLSFPASRVDCFSASTRLFTPPDDLLVLLSHSHTVTPTSTSNTCDSYSGANGGVSVTVSVVLCFYFCRCYCRDAGYGYDNEKDLPLMADTDKITNNRNVFMPFHAHLSVKKAQMWRAKVVYLIFHSCDKIFPAVLISFC